LVRCRHLRSFSVFFLRVTVPTRFSTFPYTTLFRSALAALERVAAMSAFDGAVDAAWAVYVVCAANMMRAVKAVSTYRGRDPRDRSEEHTSELQSQSNLVCRLLLEKNK